MPPNASANGPTNGMVPPTPMHTGSTPKPARNARVAASNAQPDGDLQPERHPAFEVAAERVVEARGVLPPPHPDAHPRRRLGDDLVRRPGDRMAVDADHRHCGPQPEALEHRDRGVAGELHAVAHAPRAPEAVDVLGQGRDAGALGGVGRGVVVPAAVERGVAVLVDQRGEHPRQPQHGIGDDATRHAAVHRAVERADAYVDAGQAPQRIGEPGRAHRPVAGVGQEQHVGAEGLGVRGQEAREAGGADLLLALDQDLDVAGELAGGVEPGAHRGDVRDRTRLVVGAAAAEEPAVALDRFERIGRPPLDVAGGLDVVVRVQQHRGGAGSMRPFPDDVRVTVVDPQLAHVVETGVTHEVGDRVAARVDVVVVHRVGADAGDADEILELVSGAGEVVAGGGDRGVGVHAAEVRTAAPRTRGVPSCAPMPRARCRRSCCRARRRPSPRRGCGR